MSKEHLIDLMYLFKDGESTAEERAQLFENLAYSSDLQNEFHEMVCLENNIVNSKPIANPTPALKANLFKKAGIATKSANMTYLMNFGLYSLLFVLGFLFNDIIASDDIKEIPVVQTTVKTTPQNITESTNLDLAQANSSYNHVAPASKIKGTMQSSIPVVKSENIDNKENSDINTEASPKNISGSNLQFAQSSYNVDQPKRTYTYFPTQEIAINSSTKQNSGFLSDFELSAANITGLYIFPKRTQEANNVRGLNNFSLGLNYKLSDCSHVGLEYGRETFDLFVQTQDKLILNQSQYYLVAKYRYSFYDMELFSGLYTYTEIMLGATSVGPIAKTRLGLIWAPQGMIKLYGGIEGTGLNYSYLGNPEFTGKLSFNYGIMVNF